MKLADSSNTIRGLLVSTKASAIATGRAASDARASDKVDDIPGAARGRGAGLAANPRSSAMIELRNFSSEIAHDLIVGSAVEVTVSVAHAPRFN